MSKHTPGPWHHAPMSTKTANRGVYNSAGVLIARLDIHSSEYMAKNSPATLRRIADARLCASAPDLLEALQLCVSLVRGGNRQGDAAIEAARAAMARATGGSDV